jgi:biopolymer transport protein ExbD
MDFGLEQNPKDDEIDMAPMIDMVFLLLIFFMVSSTKKQMEKREIDVPIASNAKLEQKPVHRQNVTVEKDGKIYMGLGLVDIETLTERIKKIKQKVPDIKIFLRADATVEHKEVREVMKACASVGASEIIFATYEDDK